MVAVFQSINERTRVMAKIVVVVRKDLSMTKGKIVAQANHAITGILLKEMNGGKSLIESPPKIEGDSYDLTLSVKVGSSLDDWLRGMFKKITVYCDSEEELLEIYESAKQDVSLTSILITDSGLTHFHGEKTHTCVGIGFNEESIDKITGHLKLL